MADNIEHKIAGYNGLLSFLRAAAVITVITFVILATTINSMFAWGLLTAAAILIAIYFVSAKRRKLKYLFVIKDDWGKNQVAKERDLKAVRTLFDYEFSSDKNNEYIDEQTWKDLNMDLLYTRIDRAYTDPGEAVLYRILREPCYNKEDLVKRNRTIRFFQDNPDVREKIQNILLRLGHQAARNDLFYLLWREKSPAGNFGPLFTVLALAALVSLILPFAFWSAYLILVPVIMFVINLSIHYSLKNRKDMETISVPYLIRCIKAAGKLAVFDNEEIRVHTQKLGELRKAVNKILKKARFLFSTGVAFSDPANNFLLEYLSIFFLMEIRAFYGTSNEIARQIPKLKDLYITLGELDALQAAASYRSSLPGYAVPEFVEDGTCLEVKEARQPLLDNPVPASIRFEKNAVIITGSNMGGKSTFLRNIGNNALMAQTIATTAALSYRGCFFRIITSISRTDDLIAGKSFYFVEAERILKAIQSTGGKIPALCIIDEMLSGTNSNERLAASEAIIRYLASRNTLAIIATHDLELAARLRDVCSFYHFTDNVDENGLKFDYLLKPGIAVTHNAIRLLKYLGYPGEITEKARE